MTAPPAASQSNRWRSRGSDYLSRRRNQLVLLVCLSGVYFLSFFQRVAVPGTIFDRLQASFGLTAGGVTALGTIYLYLYGGLQPVAGYLADRWGAGRTLIASGGVLCLGSLLFPWATSVPLLYATRVLVGLGAAMIYVSLIKEVSALFSARDFPLLVGLVIILGYSGGLFATYPFERLVQTTNWRTALTAVAGFGTASWLCAVRLLDRTGRAGAAPPRRPGDGFTRILRNPAMWPLMGWSALSFSVYFLLQATLGKKLLQDVCGLSSATAAAFTCVMMLVCMTGVLCSGFVARHVARRKPVIVLAGALSLIASLTLLAGVWAGLPRGAFLTAYVLLALASSVSPVSTTSIRELNSAATVGTALGISNALAYLAVALVTSTAGVILDAFADSAVRTATAVLYPPAAYRALFGVCTILALAAFACACHVTETGGAPAAPGDRRTAEDA